MSEKSLTQKIFLNNLPISKDGLAIPQPIINEESRLLQRVTVESLPDGTPCDNSFNTGLVLVAGETATASAAIATITLTEDVIAEHLSMGAMIKAGTYAYFKLEARILNGSSNVMTFRCHVRNNSAELNIPLNGMIIKKEWTIELHSRRNVTACDWEAILTISKHL